MSDITNMASVAANNFTSASTSSTENISSKLKNKKGENTDEEMMKAAKQFESYFVEQVFKELQKSVDLFGTKDKDSDSMMVDYVKDIYNQKIAEQVTEHGDLGIAQQLFENMKRNYGTVNITEAEEETVDNTEQAEEA